MNSQEQLSPKEDEINLFVFVKPLWDRWRLVIVMIIVGALFGVIYSFFAPKIYKAQVSFFMPEEAGSVGQSGGFLAGQFSSLRNTSLSQFSSILESLLQSRRLKEMVARDLKNKEESLSAALFRLQLGNVEMTHEKAVYILSFEHKNRDYIVPVVHSYIQNLKKLNQNLGLSSTRDVLHVLDEVRRPKSPYKPNRKFLILLFSGAAFFLVGGYLNVEAHLLKENNDA